MNHRKEFLPFIILFFPIILFAQKDSVLVKEASFRYEYQPFEVEKVNERYMERASYMGNYDSTYFETVTETVMLAGTDVKCIVTEPVYKTIVVTEKIQGKTLTYEKEILAKRATIKKVKVPAKYYTVTRSVFRSPGDERGGGIRDNTINPARYATHEILVLKRKTTVKRVEIPAEYQVID